MDEQLPQVYKPNICWYGVRERRANQQPDGPKFRYEQRPCGYPGLRYRVMKDGNFVTGPKAFMWFCNDHVKKMREQGYTLVQVSQNA